jgi:hypothetical protein
MKTDIGIPSRIEAARAARRFPVVLPMLGEGALSLATVRLLSCHLTAENHRELLAAAGKSKREVEELLVGYFPRPEVPPLVRKLPAPRTLPAPSAATALPALEAAEAIVTANFHLASALPLMQPTLARRPVLRPLAPDRYEIRFTASAQTREKLRHVQDLLRHAIPSGDLAEVIDRALTVLLKELARKKFAADRAAAGRSRYGSRQPGCRGQGPASGRRA